MRSAARSYAPNWTVVTRMSTSSRGTSCTMCSAQLVGLTAAPVGGPGIAPFIFEPLTQLHAALDRVYKLAVSLPDVPLARFRAKTAGLPRTTEAERLVIQRIGQDVFRDALIDYWGGPPAFWRFATSCHRRPGTRA